MNQDNSALMEVNRIPVPTWNWLKMNSGRTARISNPTGITGTACRIPEGITIKEGGTPDTSLPAPEPGCGKEIQQLIENSAVTPQYIEVNGKTDTPLVLNFTFDGTLSTVSYQTIHVREGAAATAILVYSSGAGDGFNGNRTTVFAERNSSLELIKVNLLGEGTVQTDGTDFVAGEGASLKFTQIELGGRTTFSGIRAELAGQGAKFRSNVAYICRRGQTLDMNHLVVHSGKKTECRMDVSGTLFGGAAKTYRGTVDLRKGCSGSKGNEMEETLLISPDAVNKSIPIILCGEEDVEGEHGCTIGRLSAEVLFYMQSRGISVPEAEQIITRAKIQAAAAAITDGKTADEIQNTLDRMFDNGQ